MAGRGVTSQPARQNQKARTSKRPYNFSLRRSECIPKTCLDRLVFGLLIVWRLEFAATPVVCLVCWRWRCVLCCASFVAFGKTVGFVFLLVRLQDSWRQEWLRFTYACSLARQ